MSCTSQNSLHPNHMSQMSRTMKALLLLSCLSLIFCQNPTQETPVSYKGYKGLSAKPTNEDGVKVVNDLQHIGVKILIEPSTHRPSEVAVPPEIYDKVIAALNAAQVNFTKIYDDLQEKVDAQNKENRQNQIMAQYRSGGKFDFTIATYFPSFEQTITWLKGLVLKYPKLASLASIGKTYEGRDQAYIKISTPNLTGKTKPVIWIDGGIHAREWATVPTVLFIASKLLAFYDSRDPRLSTKGMLDKYDFYLMPIFNPDGYVHTHRVDRFWRKNRRPNENGCIGVDLNRNFGHQWGVSGISHNECDESYLGPYPFSEVETKNVRDALLKFKGRFKMYVNLHAYGQLIFYPWGYDKRAHLKALSNHVQLAKVMQEAMFNTGMRRVQYVAGRPGDILYDAAGGTFDWVHAVAGAQYAFAAELSPSFYNGKGLGGFEISPNQMPIVVEEVYSAITAAVKAM